MPAQISYYYFLLMLESIETILVAIDDQVCAAFVQLSLPIFLGGALVLVHWSF